MARAIQDNSTVQHVAVDRANWGQLIHFPKIARAASIGLQPNRILMGLVFVVVLMISGQLWDSMIFSPAPVELENAPVQETGTVNPVPASNTIGPYATSMRFLESRTRYAAMQFSNGRFVSATTSVLTIPTSLASYHWHNSRAFLFAFGAWFLVLWSIASGFVCRSAACDFAIRQQIPWTEALAFALQRAASLIGVFALPLILIAIGLVMLGVGGLLLHVPGLDIVGSILYGLALMGGFALVFVAVLSTFGGMLFVPAIAVESCDAPDALARGFSFVKNRPLHFAWYILLAVSQGILIYVILLLVAQLTMQITGWGANLFLTSELGTIAQDVTATNLNDHPELETGTDGIAAGIIGIWKTLVWGLVSGAMVSYLCAAQTVVYFLMRKATDDQELDEIWIPGLIPGTLAPARGN